MTTSVVQVRLFQVFSFVNFSFPDFFFLSFFQSLIFDLALTWGFFFVFVFWVLIFIIRDLPSH